MRRFVERTARGNRMRNRRARWFHARGCSEMDLVRGAHPTLLPACPAVSPCGWLDSPTSLPDKPAVAPGAPQLLPLSTPSEERQCEQAGRN